MDPAARSHYLAGVSSLFLVRHAQASMGAEDYDNLSEHGIEQSTRLGRAFVERGMSFDAVYIGPKRRHRQTLDHLSKAAVPLGLALPEAIELKELTEIDAHLLGDEAMRRVLPSCPNLLEQLAEKKLDASGREAIRHYVGVFEALMKRWAKGEFRDRLVPYEDFSRQVLKGLQKIMRAEGRKRRVLVVTSGGPVSLSTRHALDATADRAVELMFALNNASVTELRYTENRLSLVRFNDVGYLPAHMLTGI
jgi:broad specificity phosphatase PhoE